MATKKKEREGTSYANRRFGAPGKVEFVVNPDGITIYSGLASFVNHKQLVLYKYMG